MSSFLLKRRTTGNATRISKNFLDGYYYRKKREKNADESGELRSAGLLSNSQNCQLKWNKWASNSIHVKSHWTTLVKVAEIRYVSAQCLKIALNSLLFRHFWWFSNIVPSTLKDPWPWAFTSNSQNADDRGIFLPQNEKGFHVQAVIELVYDIENTQ